MKKIIIIIFILLLSAPCYPADIDILGVGDSIMYLDPMTPLSTYLDGSPSHATTGVAGRCMPQVVAAFAADLSSYTPEKVWNNGGINDIGCQNGDCGSPVCTSQDTVTEWLTDYGTMKTAATAASATLYPMQITPSCYASYPISATTLRDDIKKWNANLEEWAYTNNVSITPTFQDMTDTTNDDCLKSSYTSDALHPNAAGLNVIGYLMSKYAVPTRSRTWGNSSYPSFGHDSFSWWTITGGSLVGGDTDAVTGYKKGGTLTLGSSDSAISPVLAILPTTAYVSITVTGTGSPSVYYRASTSNFARNAAGAWTPYTTPFTLTSGTVAFVQVKLSGTSETTQVKLDWNISYTISGTVTVGGVALSGVTMTLSGDSSSSTTTVEDGTYSFSNVIIGNHVITPSKTGYTFTPTNKSITISNASSTGNNFTTSTHLVSGTVKTAAGVAIASATISDGGSNSTTSGADGSYTLTGLVDASYTLTCTKTGQIFSPASYAVTIAGADIVAKNYVGYSVAGVAVTCGDCETTTDANGIYECASLAAGSYTCTPSLTGLAFDPTSQEVTVNATVGDVTLNFEAEPATAIGGVTITVTGCKTTTVQTDNDGIYEITGITSETPCHLVPSKTGYSFTPTSADVSVGASIGDMTQNFEIPENTPTVNKNKNKAIMF